MYLLRLDKLIFKGKGKEVGFQEKKVDDTKLLTYSFIFKSSSWTMFNSINTKVFQNFKIVGVFVYSLWFWKLKILDLCFIFPT